MRKILILLIRLLVAICVAKLRIKSEQTKKATLILMISVEMPESKFDVKS